MPIEVRGHLIVSPFTFVCDGKLYRSSNAKGWTNIQDQFGYSVFGRYQNAWRVRNVPCTSNRDSELTRGFRAALMRQTGLNYSQIDNYINDQVRKGNQVLVEGNSVKVYNGKTTVKVSGFSNDIPTVPATTPVPVKTKKNKTEGMAAHFAMLRNKGVPLGDEQAFHDWYKQNPKQSKGKPLVDAIKLWGNLTAEAVAQPEPEVMAAIEPTSVIKSAKVKKPIAENNIAVGYRRNGVPEEHLEAYHDWYSKQADKYHGMKLAEVVDIWKAETTLVKAPPALVILDIPVPQLCLPAPTPESLAADKVQKAKSARATHKYRERKKRKLVEDRDHEEDVPFYGHRRRNQAQFRADVATNCNDRCVATGASIIRCEAAHLVQHARKGGASFKNGLLLRADLHSLFDMGAMAIDPEQLTMHFTSEVLASDPDLWKLEAMKIRPTDKPIKVENLLKRWEDFNK